MMYMVKCCDNCIEYQEGVCEGLYWKMHDACWWFGYKIETEEEIINEIRNFSENEQ